MFCVKLVLWSIVAQKGTDILIFFIFESGTGYGAESVVLNLVLNSISSTMTVVCPPSDNYHHQQPPPLPPSAFNFSLLPNLPQTTSDASQNLFEIKLETESFGKMEALLKEIGKSLISVKLDSMFQETENNFKKLLLKLLLKIRNSHS